MRTFRYVTLFMLLSGLALSAEIFRCTGSAGEPAFSQHPCGDSSSRLRLAPAPGTAAATGLRPGERAWLAGRQTRAAQAAHAAAAEAVTQRARREQEDARQAYRCERRRHALDAVKAKLRRGYRPAEGERLRRRRRAHEDYLTAFCP